RCQAAYPDAARRGLAESFHRRRHRPVRICRRDTLNAHMAAARISRTTLLVALLAAVSLPYVVGLGVSSIWDANEAFYAQTPREMMAAHDYVNPSFNFQLRYNKPVFSYWEVAATYHLFGVSEWSERLPIALGGLVL